MTRSGYRKINKGKCRYCDHPVYAPSKNVNPKRACVKCRKLDTQRQHKRTSDGDTVTALI